jgi:hypothetical protein
VFEKRDLWGVDYVYAWVDGIRKKVKLSQDDRLCCGAAPGPEEAVDVFSTVLAIGDAALGFFLGGAGRVP